VLSGLDHEPVIFGCQYGVDLAGGVGGLEQCFAQYRVGVLSARGGGR
jgi:hypothetical protein